MKHLEEFEVSFIGNTPRQFTDNGVVKNYNRANFYLADKRYSVNTGGEDVSGKMGVVIFCKKGSPGLNGNKVTEDCFSLAFASAKGVAKMAREALEDFKMAGE